MNNMVSVGKLVVAEAVWVSLYNMIFQVTISFQSYWTYLGRNDSCHVIKFKDSHERLPILSFYFNQSVISCLQSIPFKNKSLSS